jgi:Skp family chaperone for outer membrane proteins
MAISLSAFVSDANAQAQARAAGTNVAILDINYIFKNNPRLKQKLDELNGDVARANEAVKKTREDLVKAEEELRGYKKGTPEYKEQEEALAKRAANFDTDVKLQRRELQERGVKIHYEAYQEILSATENFCNRAGIDLVIQFNGDQPNVDNPENLMSHIYKTVVWHRPAIDITPEILKILNGVAPATANRNNAAPQRQQIPFK